MLIFQGVNLGHQKLPSHCTSSNRQSYRLAQKTRQVFISLGQDAVAHCSTAATSRENDRRVLIRERSFLTLVTSCYIQIVCPGSIFAASAKLCSLMVVTGCVHYLWWDDGILVIWAISLYVSRVRTPKRFKIHKWFIFIDGQCLAKRRPCLPRIRFV